MNDIAPAIRAVAVDIPGLFDLELPDGRRLYDMTVGQVQGIARQNGWRIEGAVSLDESETT